MTKTKEQIADSIERSIGTALPTLFFSDDELRIIVQALRTLAPEVGESERLKKIAGKLNGIANAMAANIMAGPAHLTYWRREIEEAYDLAREPQSRSET